VCLCVFVCVCVCACVSIQGVSRESPRFGVNITQQRQRLWCQVRLKGVL